MLKTFLLLILPIKSLLPITKKIRSSRNHQFALFCLVLLAVFHRPLQELIFFSFSSDLFFYILLVPFVSIYFLYIRKKKIFSDISYSYISGSLIILVGFILFIIARKWQIRLTSNNYLAMTTFSVLMTWIGGFVFFYGILTFRKALFPILFLSLMIPIPNGLLEQLILILQKASAVTADWMFKITGLPVERDGFVFSLSKLQIEVAKQCSGIRSSLYLFMTSLVLGYLYLKSYTGRAILTLSVVPVTIFKNGLRIVTLSLLGNYVHEHILSSTFHRQGGIPLMIFAVILLSVILKWLMKSEKLAILNNETGLKGEKLSKGGDAFPVDIQ